MRINKLLLCTIVVGAVTLLLFVLKRIDHETFLEAQKTFGAMRSLTVMLGLDPKREWRPATLKQLVETAQRNSIKISYHQGSYNPFPGILRDHIYMVNTQGSKPDDVLMSKKFSFWLREDYIVLVYWNGEWESGSMKAIEEYKLRDGKLP
jgi:hypothetical protein